MRQLRAMRIGWALLILNAGLAVLDVPYAAPALIGTAILAFVLTIRFITARSQNRLRAGDSGASSSDTTHSSWVSDAFGWTALGAVHHHNANTDDHDHKPQADSSESSGGFFSFFSDSGSSDSGSSGGDSGGSDYSSSDAGSSDSGSSSGGSWD
jgi:uncharacterized membrane protein YgcG